MRARQPTIRITLLSGAAIGALATLFLTAAQAQDAPPADEAGGEEEIVVTARRQEERLLDVPAAVSAFGAKSLYERQAQNIGDLQAYVPNLSLHVGDASNAVVYVRGIGQIDSISFNDPGVGVYLDDVYMGRVQGSFLEVVDPQQIEVLRGPQGTLYGRNTIGGAVKFTSAKPSDSLEGYIDATVGSFEERTFRGRISGPINGDKTLKAALALASSQRDGYTTNLFDGEDDGDKNLMAGRFSLLYEPAGKFSAYLTVDASRSRPDRSRTPHRETPIYSVNTGGFRPVIPDPFTVDVTYNDLERLDTWGVALTLQYDLSEAITLKSISSYRKMDYRTHLDLDASRDESFGIYDFEDQNQLSQELQLLYRSENLSVVAGFFYFKEKDETFGGLVGPDFFVIIPPFTIPFPANSAGLRYADNESVAAYAQADWRFDEKASVTLGLRYTHERKWTENLGEFFLVDVAPTAEDMERMFGQGLGYNPSGFEASKSWNSLTPRIAFNYKFTDTTLGYVSASQGFKSGGFNGRVTTAAQAFDPETMWSYEAGLKTEFMDGRAYVNVAIFYQDYDDMQVSRFAADPVTGNFTAVFDNAGGARMFGFEAEFVARLTDALRIDGSVGYLDGKYTEFEDGGVDVSDERHLVNAPKWNARLGLRYEWSLGDGGDLALMAGVSHRSKTYLTVSSSEVLAQDGVTLYDAGLLYTAPDSDWTVLLSGKNLSDEAYRDHAFDLSASPGVQLGYYAAPRTYALNVRYRF